MLDIDNTSDRSSSDGDSFSEVLDNEDSVRSTDSSASGRICATDLTNEDARTNDANRSSESEKKKSSGMSSSAARQQRIENLADDILVNDTMIDNRLSDVHTTCYMRFLSREEQRTVRHEKLWSNKYRFLDSQSSAYIF